MHAMEEERRAKEGAKRGEKADLLDLLAQYDTTGPPGGKRASERASERASGRGTSSRVCSPTEPAPCIISKRIQNMIRGGKKEMIALAVTSRGLKYCHVKLEDLSCIPNYCEPSLPRSLPRTSRRESE